MSGAEMERNVFTNSEKHPSGPIRQWHTFPKEASAALEAILAPPNTESSIARPLIRNPSVVTAYLKKIDTNVHLLKMRFAELSGEEFQLTEKGLAILIREEAGALGRELGDENVTGYEVVRDLNTVARFVHDMAPRTS